MKYQTQGWKSGWPSPTSAGGWAGPRLKRQPMDEVMANGETENRCGRQGQQLRSVTDEECGP